MAEEIEKQENQEQNLFNDFDLTAMTEMSAFIENKKKEVIEEQEQPEEINDSEVQFDENGEPVEEKVEDPPSNDNNESNSSSIYTAIANFLQEGGLLQPLEQGKEISTAEDLLKVYDQQIEYRVNQYKESLDPRIKWLQDNLEQGVPMEKLLQIDADNITYNSIEESSLTSNIDLQKQIVRDYYKRSTRFSNEKIEKEINRLDDLSELESEAKSSLTELKSLLQVEEQTAIRQAQQEREAAILAQQKALETFKKSVEETTEIIPGVQLSTLMKDKIYKAVVTPVAQDNMGNPINKIGKHRMENPLDFEFKLAAIYEYTNGFTDFSVFKTPAKKAAIAELEKAAQRLDLQKNTGNLNTSRLSPETTKEIFKSMEGFLG